MLARLSVVSESLTHWNSDLFPLAGTLGPFMKAVERCRKNLISGWNGSKVWQRLIEPQSCVGPLGLRARHVLEPVPPDQSEA